MKNIELIAAPYTAFDTDGELNLDQVGLQAHALNQAGVCGAFVCGTTGEGASMTLDERKVVAEQWCQQRPSDLKVIVHVGHTCLRDAQELARHAQQIGADSFAAIAPFYFKPDSIQSLGQWCRELASAAPDLPFYYYHMPSMSGVNLSMEQLLTHEAPSIPNFAGIKFTYENLYDFARCTEIADGKYQMLFGRDEILLSAIPLGAKGAVGSTYNYAAPIYLKMIHAYKHGDIQLAAQYQKKAQQIVALLIKYGGMACGKAIMKLIGIDCGPMRSPLKSLESHQVKQLEAELNDIEFFDAIGQTVQTSNSIA
jgi:N-acetylneuraminate lyase